MYSEKTIEKYYTKMSELIQYYRINPAPLKISPGNNKIGRVPNVSTAAVFTCPHCKQCKYHCYDIRDCYVHGWSSAITKARAANTALFFYHQNRYFKQLDDWLSENEPPYFRIHVGGEYRTHANFVRYMNIVLKHPDTTFWCYTKEYGFVNKFIREYGKLPENIHVMFSEWRGLRMNNPYSMPVFKVRFKGEAIPEADHQCPGNCEVCIAAGCGCMNGCTVWVNQH